ncbi:MAG: PqqD family peptide modification chaperone [Gemmatimonadales bacterium]|nr:PqqD family protein [Gemmatimonadota bacterium]MCL4213196.1 PqqD family peptide modification chaperone [Gemmatimonadales bacterium]
MLPSANPAVLFQRLDDGAVLFSPTSEQYFGLNEVGVRIWTLLPPATTSLDELVLRLADAYPEVAVETMRADAEQLLESLLEADLVLPVSPKP